MLLEQENRALYGWLSELLDLINYVKYLGKGLAQINLCVCEP